MRLRLLSVAAALLGGLALAACGAGGENGEAAIRETITTASMSDDPADCERLHTLRFLETMSGLEGEAAVAACEQQTVDPNVEDAESVIVTGVEVEDGRASADAAFEGSTLDGQTVSLELVEEDGRWKLDGVAAFARFDRDALVTALAREVASLARELGGAAVVACLVGWIEARDDEQLQALAIEPDQGELLGVLEDCVRRGEAGQSL